jgi:hypothetical protein
MDSRAAVRLSAWPLLVAIVTAISLAFASPPLPAQTPAAASASAVVAAPPAPAAAPPAAAPAYPGAPKPLGGLAALPGDQQVPHQLLPPGSGEPDTGPSDVIFPAQHLTVRFNHKFHVGQGASCKTCHPGASTSQSVNDHLIPPGTVCDACHMTDHSDLNKVTPGDDESGKCAFCHVGYAAGDGNKVARLELPRANMVFNHKAHATRNIGCAQCHGTVQDLELATRDQLPRMPGCFACHQRSEAAQAQGDAKSACITCHFRGTPSQKNDKEAPGLEGGSIRTIFAAGVLKPPRWLHDAAHTPDFIERHKMIAANDSQFCANCHKEEFCTNCHDGRVRPRSIHPADYISMHPIEARMATQRCTSCHQEQSFCLNCHMRVGVAESAPPGVRDSGRFHPPKSIWSDAPRQPGHHSFEAERNLNACVSCHIERDCVVCHGGQGIGAGFNPHHAGFAAGCATQMRRNPRPCFVCHEPGEAVLATCR